MPTFTCLETGNGTVSKFHRSLSIMNSLSKMSSASSSAELSGCAPPFGLRWAEAFAERTSVTSPSSHRGRLPAQSTRVSNKSVGRKNRARCVRVSGTASFMTRKAVIVGRQRQAGVSACQTQCNEIWCSRIHCHLNFTYKMDCYRPTLVAYILTKDWPCARRYLSVADRAASCELFA